MPITINEVLYGILCLLIPYVIPLIDGPNNDPRYVYNIEHQFGGHRYGFKFLKLIKSSPKDTKCDSNTLL